MRHRGAGCSQAEAGRREGLARNKVGHWERRFAAQGLVGLEDKKGRGRKSWLEEEKKARMRPEVTRPPKGHARWTVRGMARHAGISVGAVHGLWRANDLKPHRTRTFKLSRDPQFDPKFWRSGRPTAPGCRFPVHFMTVPGRTFLIPMRAARHAWP